MQKKCKHKKNNIKKKSNYDKSNETIFRLTQSLCTKKCYMKNFFKIAKNDTLKYFRFITWFIF